MSEYHEPYELLSPETQNFHRALKSLQEELEAVDWYHQRAQVCRDPALKAVIEHNRDEEMEHSCMILEWLRRNMPGWDKNLRTYLFKDDPITEIEEVAEKTGKGEESAPAAESDGSLSLGDLKKGGTHG